MSRFSNLIHPYFEIVTVTTAGTPVQATAKPIPPGCKVTYRAHPDNTGFIYLGATSADALSTSTAHTRLSADQAELLQLSDAAKVFINSSVSGEKVIVSFEL